MLEWEVDLRNQGSLASEDGLVVLEELVRVGAGSPVEDPSEYLSGPLDV